VAESYTKYNEFPADFSAGFPVDPSAAASRLCLNPRKSRNIRISQAIFGFAVGLSKGSFRPQ
jgi:hypothetical protein